MKLKIKLNKFKSRKLFYQGFTLIELLAVIIILAIIALIATPVVIKVIDSAKESARKSSVAGYADAIKLAINEKMFDNKGTNPVIDETFLSSVNYQGSTVSCNEVKNTNNYGVILKECTVGINESLYCFANGKVYSCDNTEFLDIYNKLLSDIEFLPDGTSSYQKNATVKIIVNSENTINNLKYLWENNGETPNESEIVNELSNNQILDVPNNPNGEWILWVLVEDNHGIKKLINSNIFKIDNVSPEIVLLGNNPFNVTTDDTNFIEPGYTATDNIIGNVTESVTINNNFVYGTPGTYDVIYSVEDLAGNKTEVIRKVNMIVQQQYSYTGNYQEVILQPGRYTFELWGASGGGASGGKGGYSKGTMTISEATTFYLYIGGAGVIGTSGGAGGWNGGAGIDSDLNRSKSGGGGGATDIRLVSGSWNNAESLNSRIIVAGGGSGYGYSSIGATSGKSGGGLAGTSGSCFTYSSTFTYPQGGTQTSGYSLGGGEIISKSTIGGAGGGYYGGYGCSGTIQYGAGGGGSGIVPGYEGVASSLNGYTFENSIMTSGVNLGNGKISITNN